MSYLVTGAAGFIGARFVEACNQKGISTISVDTADHFTSHPEHRTIRHDLIVDRDQLFAWLEDDANRVAVDSIEAVVHMGACSDTMETDESYLNRVNVEYSKKIWQFARAKDLPLVYASSAATYGEGEAGYSDDESTIDRLRPLNLYGLSKQKFDQWALKNRVDAPKKWYGLKFFNVYGFGEEHKGKMRSVVYAAYQQIKEKGSVRLFRSHREGIEDGHQKRDFVCVEDVIDITFFLLEQNVTNGIYNVGTGQARTFLDLARATFSAMGVPEKIEFIDTPEALRPRYQYFTQAEMGKLTSGGYDRPFTSLEDGVKTYVKRLKEYHSQ